MINVKRDFQARCDEINLYFKFLENIESHNGNVLLINSIPEKMDIILVETLKANSILLLYNLAESSVKKATEAIIDELIKNGVKYEEAKEQIRKEFIKFLKKVNTEEFVFSVNNISEDIISYCLTVKENRSDIQPQYIKELFSGNVQAQTIRGLAERYEFSFATNPRQTNNGKALETIKERRNDLAHGVYSFQEVGKNLLQSDLTRMKEQVIEYLRQILDNVEVYIKNKDFLK